MSNKLILMLHYVFRCFGTSDNKATRHRNIYKDSVNNINNQTFHNENIYIINIFLVFDYYL